MTDLRKAAEMALEALEWNYGTDLCDIENCTAWLDKMNATIPALRQALAQPEQYRCHWVEKGKGHCERNKRMGFDDDYGNPKREWVGLTDEEIGWLWHNSPPNSHEYARAIEAKLKEKNT